MKQWMDFNKQKKQLTNQKILKSLLPVGIKKKILLTN